MANFYLITSYTATILSGLSFIILFIKRKEGGRPRLFLCFIMFVSIFLFLQSFLRFFVNNQLEFSISIPVLLLAIIFMTFRATYILEVISPYFISLKKALLFFIPLFSALAAYFVIEKYYGISFNSYKSITEMSGGTMSFNEISIILLCFMYYLPLLYTLYIYENSANKESTSKWFKKHYLSLFLFATTFIPTLFDHARFFSFQYIALLIFTFYIVYLELFVRIADTNNAEAISTNMSSDNIPDIAQAESHNEIFEKLDSYMKNNKAWRDHEINMSTLVRYLGTNRTTFARVIQENGHENYSAYINKYRIEDFIEIIKSGEYENYQDVFLDVGFKSRATALRNFKHFTGAPPSEYFKSEHDPESVSQSNGLT